MIFSFELCIVQHWNVINKHARIIWDIMKYSTPLAACHDNKLAQLGFIPEIFFIFKIAGFVPEPASACHSHSVPT